MPRQAREKQYNESNCFHVLMQGIAKSYIFESDMNKSFYLKFLSDKIKQYEISLLAFCIMGNHAHLLIYSENQTQISKYLQEVNVTYSQFYNRENRRVGYVFRGRFRTEPIKGEKYLINCISYIHQNPVKAGITRAPEEYAFSSAKSYNAGYGMIDFKALEKIFGGIPEKSEATSVEFLDDEYEGKKELGEAIEDAMINNNIRDIKKASNNQLRTIVTEIQSNTKTSLRELAKIFEINRERLRKVMSSATSP